MRPANLALRFLLELAMLAALAYGGWVLAPAGFWQWAAAIGLPVVAAVVWGLFVAPRATKPVPVVAWLAIQVVLFGAACALLWWAGHHTLAIVFAVVVVGNGAVLAWTRPARGRGVGVGEAA